MSAELSELMPSRRHEALRIIGDQHSNPVHEIITAWAISVTISSGPPVRTTRSSEALACFPHSAGIPLLCTVRGGADERFDG